MNRIVFCAVLALAGCSKPPAGSPPATFASAPSADHSHERGKMMLVDAPPYHALLTAHLSKAGHELDIFFEEGGEAKPVALPLESFVADVQIRAGEGGVKQVEFRPAPADERPAGEPAGRCSHFVAAVPWLDPDVPLRVTVEFTLDGKKVKARWNDFVPRKYAHHQD